jgi:glycosyltransferase involved in cell wall biosynthesis
MLARPRHDRPQREPTWSMTAPLTLDPLPIATPRVLVDVSRLLRRREARFGTGVDRIDLAVARDLMARFGEHAGFVHATPLGPALLTREEGVALISAVAARWRGAPAGTAPRILPGLARAALRPIPPGTLAETTYVNASHSGLPLLRGALARLDPARRLTRLAYIHDLIPIDFPEYQRPDATVRFRRFLDEIADGPVAFVANSADTARGLAAFAAARGWPAADIAVRTPRLDVAAAPAPPSPSIAVAGVLADPSPFLLCVGTIEPRKNHLLLLNLWRALAAENRAPRLVLVGRRGWENEQVVDMLDRCPAMQAHVREFGDLADGDVAALMRGARALLLPSFAEGLGLPVLEAAATGTRAILSDLPALREIAAPGTVFIDPLDGPAWKRAIIAALA